MCVGIHELLGGIVGGVLSTSTVAGASTVDGYTATQTDTVPDGCCSKHLRETGAHVVPRSMKPLRSLGLLRLHGLLHCQFQAGEIRDGIHFCEAGDFQIVHVRHEH